MYVKTSDGFVYETATLPTNATSLTNAAGKAAIKQQAIGSLREILKPGQTVYSVLRHVSASGMSRRISFMIPVADGSIQNLDYFIGLACDYKQSDNQGLIVSGCGMDMGFAVVYRIGRIVWPDGTPEPHGRRNGAPDSDGGYALKSEWI